MRLSLPLLTLSLLSLVACQAYPTTRPDYAIRVTPDAAGGVATPPACLSWQKHEISSFDNQHWPQFGCATQRNLALMVERPEDLLYGRPMGPADPANTANALQNYRNGVTRGLIDPAINASSVAVTTAKDQSASSPAPSTSLPTP